MRVEPGELYPLLAGAIVAAGLAPAALGQPPAPPLPQVQKLADQLTQSINDCKMEDYAAPFADELKVFENGKQVASDKAAWLTIQQKRCRSQEARLRAVNTAPNSLLIVDDVMEPRTVKPNEIWECCAYARAAAYKLRASDFKITEVRFLINEPGYWTSQVR